MTDYNACIVEESLDDNRAINNHRVFGLRITDEQNPRDRWHIYQVLLSPKEIDELHAHIKQGWYLHCWNEKEIIVLFKGRKFVIDPKKKETWKAAVDYGLSLGIPAEQLDFPKEF